MLAAQLISDYGGGVCLIWILWPLLDLAFWPFLDLLLVY
jgi:hypothetical protein